ncbi:MAG: RimK/LysX family protein [Candidatus Saccharimonadales bacterium]
MKELTIIGRNSIANFPEEGIKHVPVKIDTGAHSSSIWASQLHIDDDFTLHFVLFGVGSPFYSGKVHSTKSYKVRVVRSSNGTTQIRYRVMLSMVLGGRRVKTNITLADRSRNIFPVLVGCRTLQSKFLVDVSKGKVDKEIFEEHNNVLNDELEKNPQAFFKKYHLANERGDIIL